MLSSVAYEISHFLSLIESQSSSSSQLEIYLILNTWKKITKSAKSKTLYGE